MYVAYKFSNTCNELIMPKSPKSSSPEVHAFTNVLIEAPKYGDLFRGGGGGTGYGFSPLKFLTIIEIVTCAFGLRSTRSSFRGHKFQNFFLEEHAPDPPSLRSLQLSFPL